MSNDLGGVAVKYTDILDEIVSAETKTADLNMNQKLLGEYKGHGKIEIPKMSLQGLADYSKSNGFVKGDITLDFEEKQLEYDRGREFDIDDVDDEERLEIVSMNIMSEFARTKVVPEVDAIRFARLADAAGTKVSKTFSGSSAVDDAVAAVDDAEAIMQDAGAELSECIFYCTAAFKKLLKEGQAWRFGSADKSINRNFDEYDDMKVVVVPQNRFYSKLALNDGSTSGQEAGGYGKADDGKDINFLIVDPKAAAALNKHEKLRYFAPDVNQDADYHKWQYRLYHDLLTFDNKACLIYVSKKA